MRIFGISLICLVLTACGGAPRPAPAAFVDMDGGCNAPAFAYLVGQPAEELEKVLILRPVRIIRPGDAVTLDFFAERLNFEISEAGRIVRLTCG